MFHPNAGILPTHTSSHKAIQPLRSSFQRSTHEIIRHLILSLESVQASSGNPMVQNNVLIGALSNTTAIKKPVVLRYG